jgi:hypothetical protein
MCGRELPSPAADGAIRQRSLKLFGSSRSTIRGEFVAMDESTDLYAAQRRGATALND